MDCWHGRGCSILRTFFWGICPILTESAWLIGVAFYFSLLQWFQTLDLQQHPLRKSLWTPHDIMACCALAARFWFSAGLVSCCQARGGPSGCGRFEFGMSTASGSCGTFWIIFVGWEGQALVVQYCETFLGFIQGGDLLLCFLLFIFPVTKLPDSTGLVCFLKSSTPRGSKRWDFYFCHEIRGFQGNICQACLMFFFFLEHLKLTNPSRFVRRIVSASFLQNSFAGQHRGQHGGIRFISHQIWALSCEVTR